MNVGTQEPLEAHKPARNAAPRSAPGQKSSGAAEARYDDCQRWRRPELKKTKRSAILAIVVACMLTAPAWADTVLPAQAVEVSGAPVQAVGCTAARGASVGGYVNDFYIRGNASFIDHASVAATEVAIDIHYSGAYGDHDVLIDKKGLFAPNVRIDPKRRAWVAMLEPQTLNIDVDGSREIDIWGTVGATCTVVGAAFADGSVWRLGQDNRTNTPSAPVSATPLPAPKCHFDAASQQYVCS